jgi:[phosphatase 2A protein]-leucine-carboxy methyltransferase
MESNLAARGIHLQTLHRYCNLTAQRTRLKMAGLTAGQCAADVDFIFEQWIEEREKERVGKCEMLDELEEWRLLAKHYCVAWGWRDGDGESGEVFGRAWKAMLQQEDGD